MDCLEALSTQTQNETFLVVSLQDGITMWFLLTESALLHFKPGPGPSTLHHLVFVIKQALRHCFSHFASEKTVAQGSCDLCRVRWPGGDSVRTRT